VLLEAVVVLLALWWLAQRCDGLTSGGGLPSGGSPPGRSLPAAPSRVPDSTLPAAVPAEDLVARARDSAAAARSVHLSGTADLTGDGPVTVALTLTSRAATGTVTVAGRRYEVIRVGSEIWTRSTGSGPWVAGDQVDTDAGPVSLFRITDRGRWFATIVPSPEGATATPGTERLDGATVRRTRLRDGSLLFVLADPARPYPVRLTGTPIKPAELRLTGWDRPVTIAPPPGH
jgi:hypothetical protein